MKKGRLGKTRWLLGSVVCIVILAFLVCAGSDAYAQSAKKPVLLGISQGVTGFNADAGRAGRDAIILAIEDWNSKGGVRGHKIEYLFRDNAGDPTKAVTIAKEFIREGVSAVFGGTSSTVAIPEAKVLSEVPILLMSGSATTKPWDYKAADGKSYYFSFPGTDPVIAEGALHFLAQQGYKKVVIANVNVAWPKGLTEYQLAFIKEKYGPKHGMEVVGVEEADIKATDISQLVSKVKSLKPDAVITNFYGVTFVAWFRACNDLDYHPPAIGFWSLAETAYNSMDPVLMRNYIGYSQFSPEKKAAAEKLNDFIKRWGYTPTSHWCFAYQEAVTVLTAMEAVGFEGPQVRDYIASKMTGTPIIVGSKDATCFFQEGSSYFYSLFGPDGFAYVKIDEKGKQVWVRP